VDVHVRQTGDDARFLGLAEIPRADLRIAGRQVEQDAAGVPGGAKPWKWAIVSLPVRPL
jgi:hypothetical protein